MFSLQRIHSPSGDDETPGGASIAMSMTTGPVLESTAKCGEEGAVTRRFDPGWLGSA